MSWRTDPPPQDRIILGWWKHKQRFMLTHCDVVRYSLHKDYPLRSWSTGYFRYEAPTKWRDIEL